jgi:hypothetical protein
LDPIWIFRRVGDRSSAVVADFVVAEVESPIAGVCPDASSVDSRAGLSPLSCSELLGVPSLADASAPSLGGLSSACGRGAELSGAIEGSVGMVPQFLDQ